MIHIFGGGTDVYISNHLSLSVPAKGSTARHIDNLLSAYGHKTQLHLTSRADHTSALIDIDVVEVIDGRRSLSVALNCGTNKVTLAVTSQPFGGTSIAAIYDNLGKGAASAAAENLRLMLSPAS